MPCRPFFCDHARDCGDTRCPGHPGLQQADGGMHFRDGIAFPIELPDEPTVTPEQAEGWTAYASYLLVAIAAAFAALAYLAHRF